MVHGLPRLPFGAALAPRVHVTLGVYELGFDVSNEAIFVSYDASLGPAKEVTKPMIAAIKGAGFDPWLSKEEWPADATAQEVCDALEVSEGNGAAVAFYRERLGFEVLHDRAPALRPTDFGLRMAREHAERGQQ